MGKRTNRGGNGNTPNHQHNQNNRNWPYANRKTNSGKRPSCKYCGKDNHSSDQCHFKDHNEQQTSNGNQAQNGNLQNLNGNQGQQGRKKVRFADQQNNLSCNYCGEVGHVREDCRLKVADEYEYHNGIVLAQKATMSNGLVCSFCGKAGHTEDICRRKNGAQKNGKVPAQCSFCGMKGHTEDICRKKNGGNNNRQGKQGHFKHIAGNSDGQFGAITHYEMPLRVQHRHLQVHAGTYEGVKQYARGNEDNIVDMDGDVLMCHCDGTDASECLVICASKLYQQKDPMWLSRVDKIALYNGMLYNNSWGVEQQAFWDEWSEVALGKESFFT